jgi:hypothetical protein
MSGELVAKIQNKLIANLFKIKEKIGSGSFGSFV